MININDVYYMILFVSSRGDFHITVDPIVPVRALEGHEISTHSL
jgi:hypothetical protein